MRTTLDQLRSRVRAQADPARVLVLQRFFKTAPGQYAAGDVFAGVTVPQLRSICREAKDVAIADAAVLLRSDVHEERLLALLLLVDAFRRGSTADRRQVYELYLASTAFINNWDLVDSSAPQIVGGWLQDRSRKPLTSLARSASVWERRIAMLATFHFIKRRDFADALRVADMLLADEHDLIHKAVGWMLREVGNRDGSVERQFLKTRYRRMPRTMLRYAIEKFPQAERRRYLDGDV